MKLFIVLALFVSCNTNSETLELPWKKHGKLLIRKDSSIIEHQDGKPFLWLGCTAWGMTEWLTREDVDLYLDDRQSKGMNVVQFCLFWGKRTDNPTTFYLNPKNPYGHKAFVETRGFPDATMPAVADGGSSDNPNDYWDHVDYCLEAIKQRGMYAAVLPFWGRRYVNASHKGQSHPVFTADNIRQYGEFLGKRYGHMPNIIWVNGGDVKADEGGDYVILYRLFVEGLAKGITAQDVGWQQKHAAWDEFLMTYHPAGHPMINSSEWFHDDPWLDFNMIETHVHRDMIAASIRQDLALQPLKPTVMGEGHYEGETNGRTAHAIHIRRQAYQTFFAGAGGHTYGGGFDEQGNGPLFSPSNNWKHLLDWPGAGQMLHLKAFLQKHEWWNWQPLTGMIAEGQGVGELEKLAVKSGALHLIYFPDNTPCTVNLDKIKKAQWFNTKSGDTQIGSISATKSYQPPDGWQDAVLLLHR